MTQRVDKGFGEKGANPRGREIVYPPPPLMSNIAEGLDDETWPRLDSVQLRYYIMNIHDGVSARCFITPSPGAAAAPFSVLRSPFHPCSSPPSPPHP